MDEGNLIITLILTATVVLSAFLSQKYHGYCCKNSHSHKTKEV